MTHTHRSRLRVGSATLALLVLAMVAMVQTSVNAEASLLPMGPLIRGPEMICILRKPIVSQATPKNRAQPPIVARSENLPEPSWFGDRYPALRSVSVVPTTVIAPASVTVQHIVDRPSFGTPKEGQVLTFRNGAIVWADSQTLHMSAPSGPYQAEPGSGRRPAVLGGGGSSDRHVGGGGSSGDRGSSGNSGGGSSGGSSGMSESDADGRYVNVIGDTMVGGLRIEYNGLGLAVTGTISGAIIHAEQSLSSSGTLVWEGDASGSTLYVARSFNGAGLADCDNATSSKLLWDSTTGRFSCGTDQSVGTGLDVNSGDERYVKKQGDTMTGALTIDVRGGNANTIALKIINTLSGANIHAERSLTSSGTLVAEGLTTLNGNIVLGDATSDSLTINARIASDLIPASDDTYDLGTPSLRFGSGYFATGVKVGNSIYILSDSVEGTHGIDLVARGANNLTFTTNGVERARIDSTGKFGIGVTDASTALEVLGTASGTDLFATRSITGSHLYIASTIGGAGLASCNGSTSKLLYNASTKQFSCGTDLNTAWSGTGALQSAFDSRYVNTSGDTMTGNLLVKATLSGRTLIVSQNASISGALVSAGNITTRGTLSGARLYVATTASISGSLAIENSLTGATFFGFGLTDCSNSTISKLIYNATTGKFSCASDQSGIASNWSNTGSLQNSFDSRYVNTSGDTMTGNLLVKATLSGRTLIVSQNASISGALVSAGNITTRGTLSGARLYVANTASISGSLAIENSLTGANFYGFGLTDCSNSTTSKLIYNATTGKFSCASDQNTGTTYTAGQGLTLTSTSFRLSDTFSGTTIRVLGSLSGAILHAERTLTSSGTLVVNGVATFRSNLSGSSLFAQKRFTGSGSLTLNRITPTILSTYDTGTAQGIATAGRYAYVADIGLSPGLYVVDVTDPTNPTSVGSVSLSNPNDVAVAGRYAYVVDSGSATFRVIDVAVPASPVVVGTVSGFGSTNAVTVAGRYAYAVGSTVLTVVDISNPASPVTVGTYNNGAADVMRDVIIVGQTAYVAQGTVGLLSLDVSNPARPRLISTYDSSGSAQGVAVSGRYAYLADGSAGLKIVSIATPTSPSLVGTYDTPGTAYDVRLSGHIAVVADSSSLQIIDVTTPSSPTSVTSVATSGSARLTLVGRLAFIADVFPGIRIIDLGGIDAPSASIGSIDTDALTVRGDNRVLGHEIIHSSLTVGQGLSVLGQTFLRSTSGAALTIATDDLSGAPVFIARGLLSGSRLTISGNVNVTGSLLSVGNIVTRGTLSGSRLFVATTASISGSLVIENSLTGATFFGFGLTSCSNSTTSKLLYNSATGKFSCGTDQGGSYTAGQGLTLTSSSFRLSDTFSGTTIRVLGSLSGAIIHAERTLTSSGTILANGNISTRGTLSGGALTVMNGTSYALGNFGLGTTSPKAKLDVVGTISGKTLVISGNASVSGSLVVQNNITARGTLSGARLFVATTASISGSLAIENSLTGATFFGFGLTSCSNSTTSKLLYNSATGKFSCGTDQGSSYTAGQGLTLTSSSFRLSDTFSGTTVKVLGSLSGAYLFAQKQISTSGSVIIADIRPSYVGSYTLTNAVNGVFVDGKYAYVPDSTDTFKILDVTTTTPALISATSLGGADANGVYVSGRYAYVTAGVDGLKVLDISKPSSPIVIASMATTNARDIVVVGRYAYLADGSAGVRVLDVSNPYSPVTVGTYDTAGSAVGLWIQGRYAYVADNTNGMVIIDISSPTSPFLVSTFAAAGSVADIVVVGRYAYLGATTAGLQIVDVKNPASPSSVSTLSSTYAIRIDVLGRYVYVADLSGGFKAIDASNPSSPTLVHTVSTYNVTALQVLGRYAYVIEQSSPAFRMIDIGGIEAPSATIGALEAHSFNVLNDSRIRGNLSIGSMLNVGAGLNVYGQASIRAFSGTALTLSSQNAGTSAVLNVIGLMSGSRLTLSGNANITGSILAVGNIRTRGTLSGGALTVMNGTSYALGNFGIGTTSPKAKLDVVGTISGKTLVISGNASVSGSLVVQNNITARGTLSGARLYVATTASISGSLAIENSLTGATFFGFGLTDCTSSTSKLLYNASTGKFSCSTDLNTAWSNTGALQTAFDARYVNTAGDTMTGAFTINITGGSIGTVGLKLINTLSGAQIHAERTLTSSSALIIQGNATIRGVLSGSILHAEKTLSSSGGIVWRKTASGNGLFVKGFLNVGTSYSGTLMTVSLVGSGASTATATSATLLSVDQMGLAQLKGGAYFGRVGLTENQWALSHSGAVWVARDSSRSTNSAIAMSSDGRIQAMAAWNSYLMVSTDYGVTWQQRGSSSLWNVIAMSSDGRFMATAANNGTVYTSNDFGVTWTARGSLSRVWKAIAMSSDGKYLTLTSTTALYTSSDYGTTWVSRDTARAWYGVAMSSDGRLQTVSVDGGRLYVSTDYGVTWTARLTDQQWRYVAMSSDGRYQMAGVFLGSVYSSSDFGNTWTSSSIGTNPGGIAMSSEGRIRVVGSNKLYLSQDYGQTWNTQGVSASWISAAVSSDGRVRAIIPSSGQIYTSYATTYQMAPVVLGTGSAKNALLHVVGAISGSRLIISNNATISGSLVTVGNITTRGTLSGARLYVANTASISGSLVIENSLTGATFFGFGLTDCSNSTTSKLIYNASTGKFSCATDQTGGGGTYTAGQGLTLTSSSFRLSDTFSGTTVKVLSLLSGSLIHAEKALTSSGVLKVTQSQTRDSGALVVDQRANSTGAYITSRATGAPLLVLEAGGTTSRTAHIVFGYLGTFDTNLYRVSAGTLRTDGSFQVVGTLSGAFIHAEKSLTSSGVLKVVQSTIRDSGALVVDQRTTGTGMYIRGSYVASQGNRSPLLALDSGTASSLAPHILFGYKGTFDVSLFRGGTGSLTIASATGKTLLLKSNRTDATGNLFEITSDYSTTNNKVFRVQANGTTYADGAYNATGADYAEWFLDSGASDHPLKPGELVCIDVLQNNAVRRCERSGDTNLMGIVSTNPAFIGNTFTGADGIMPPGYVLVGLIGQVPASVSLENGAIHAGDALTSSEIPGVARRANAGESTVGVALEAYDGSQATNIINVLISRKNQSVTVELVEQHIVESIANMGIEDKIAQSLKDSLSALNLDEKVRTSLSTELSKFDLAGQVHAIINQHVLSGSLISGSALASTESRISALTASSAVLSSRIQSSTDALTALRDNVRVLQSFFTDGVLAINAVHTTQLTTETITARSLTVSGTTVLSGHTSIGTLDIDGSRITIGSLTSPGAFEVIGTVTINGLARFLGNVSIEGQLVLSSKQAGFAVIPATGSRVTVHFETPLIATGAIHATPQARVGAEWWVESSTATGFTIAVSSILDHDVRFAWTAIAVDHPRTVMGTGALHAGAGPIPFYVNLRGQPTSSDQVWNACIQGRQVILDGNVLSCSRYHNEYTWEHPDLLISFTYNPNHEPPILLIPDGYVITPIDDGSGADAGVPAGGSSGDTGGTTGGSGSDAGSSDGSSTGGASGGGGITDSGGSGDTSGAGDTTGGGASNSGGGSDTGASGGGSDAGTTGGGTTDGSTGGADGSGTSGGDGGGVQQ